MSGHAGEMNLYVQAIKNRLWLVAILVIIAMAGAYWSVGRAPSRYAATATLLIRGPLLTRTPTVTGGAEAGARDGGVNDFIQLINSRPIATRVATRLNISAPSVVQRAVRAEPVRGTSLMRISGTAQSPEQAADLANVTAEEFVAYFRDTNRAGVSEVRRFVEEQLNIARTRLEASERALQAFRENRGILSVADATSRVASAVASVETQLDGAIRARQEAEARMAALRDRLVQERPLVVSSRATTENPAFRRFQTYLVDLELRRAQLSQQYTPQHPRMEQITREIADVKGRLLTEARTMVGEEVTTGNPIHARLAGEIVNLEVERAVLSARIEGLRFAQRQRQTEVMAIPSTETEYNRLTRENRILEASYQTLAARHQDILLRENEAGFFPASLQVIEAAVPPARTSPSPFPRTAAAAGLIGLVLGLAAALLLEALDDGVRSAQDAERALGVPVLAQIPTQGMPRIAPAPAAFVIAILLAAALAAGAWAWARGHVAMPGTPRDGLRAVASTVTSWVGAAQPAVNQIGIAGGDR